MYGEVVITSGSMVFTGLLLPVMQPGYRASGVRPAGDPFGSKGIGVNLPIDTEWDTV